MFAVSNQLGMMGGASLGDFPFVGIFCMAAAVMAAVIIQYKVQRTGEFRRHVAIS
jgi:hypothetical protein